MRNILELSMSPFALHKLPKLPLSFISEEHDVDPKNLVLTEDERAFLATVQATEQNSYDLEQDTCKLWKNSTKSRITSSNALRDFIKKRNFQTLAESFLNPNLESDLHDASRSASKYGHIYETVAHQK